MVWWGRWRYNEGIRNTRQWLRVQDELKLNASTSSTSSGTNTTLPSGSSGAVTQGGTVGSASQVQTNVAIVTALNMPRVEIDVFSGNPLEYQSFMAVFNDSVDSQPIKDQGSINSQGFYNIRPVRLSQPYAIVLW